jgi:thioredoxin-related protein
VTGQPGAAETRDPYGHFFQDTFGDFTEELQLAREEGKQGVLIFFEMDECPFCHRMKQTVLNQPEVQDYYRKHFRIFAVDIEGDIEVVDFEGITKTQKDWAFKDHRVRATPVFAFFDLEGERVARYTGATSGPEEFLWLGEFVADGHYRETNFTKFKREKRQQSRQ